MVLHIRRLAACIVFAGFICGQCVHAQELPRTDVEAQTSADSLLPRVWRPVRPFGSQLFPEWRRPKIGIVLSGGGARGLAQIGVLKALVEAGITPDVVVGTSIGSIIGGLFAAGYQIDELETAIKAIDWDELLRLSNQSGRENLFIDQKPVSDRSILTLRFDGLRPVLPTSVSNGQRLTNLLNELTLNAPYHSRDFDALKIPFRAVATDLYSGRRVVLGNGPLAEAIRASATVPVLYAPVMRDSMALVDGGMQANIPVDVARELGCDIVIAVNTTSPPRQPSQITNPIETLDQVLNVLMERSNTEQLRRADIVIEPALGTLLATDFQMTDTLIIRGYRSATERIPAIISTVRRAVDTLLAERTDAAPATVVMDGVTRGGEDTGQGSALADRLFSKAFRNSANRIDMPAASIIRDIQVEGARNDHALRVIAETQSSLYRPMTGSRVRHLCENVLRYYRSLGYALADVTILEADTLRGSISLRVREGTIAGIDVVGNTRTNPVVILRELPFREGETFRVQEARAGLNNLAGLGLFHQVSLEIRDTEGGPRVVLHVEERSSQELRVGVLVDAERNAQFGIDLRDANIFGSGSELTGLFFGGFDNRRYEGVYNTNRLFYTNLNMSLHGYYDLRDYSVYTDAPVQKPNRFEREQIARTRLVRYGASATAGMYAGRFGNLYATARFEDQSLRTIDANTAEPPGDEQQTVVSITLGTTIDTRDRYPYPTRGMHFAFAYTSAQSALGSTRAFSKVATSYSVVLSDQHADWSLQPRVLFGYGDRTMPRAEEFRLGGMQMFHGLRENSFTGQQIFVASFDARWHIPLRILFDSYLSVRYDIGRVWEIPEQIKFKDLRHGIGLTVGLDTPIGPADFSIGRSMMFVKGANATYMRLGPVQLSFSIGTGF
ncbi:MAG: patatin-like phospholipase family protein [Ignavibacteriae bacterium]|nr:patatin-like phospholipase family protein [Ignavibacteriota bacterium]